MHILHFYFISTKMFRIFGKFNFHMCRPAHVQRKECSQFFSIWKLFSMQTANAIFHYYYETNTTWLTVDGYIRLLPFRLIHHCNQCTFQPSFQHNTQHLQSYLYNGKCKMYLISQEFDACSLQPRAWGLEHFKSKHFNATTNVLWFMVFMIFCKIIITIIISMQQCNVLTFLD